MGTADYCNKRKRLSRADRRQQILRVATEIFSRNGFRGTTLRQLAKRAGISEATIYQHFPSKEALYDAILEQRMDNSRHLFFPRQAAESKQDRELMNTLIENFLHEQATDNSFLRMLLFSALEGHDLARKFVTGHMRKFYRFLSTYLSQRMDDGALKPMDPQLTARLLMGMVLIVVLHREIFQDPIMTMLDIERLPSQVVDLFCHGVMAAPKPTHCEGTEQ
jgi:AcrR family transcriptional regulator